MGKKLSHEEQIVAIEHIHGKDLFIFHEEFKSNQSDTFVTCIKHGSFKTRANRLKAGHGCPICGNEKSNQKKIKQSDIQLKKLEEKHPNKFEILSTIGKRKDYIDIKCKICNHTFNTTLGSLLTGTGCPNCAINLKGWSYSNWEQAAFNSKVFDSFKIYIIHCFNETESFIKVGKTFSTITHRFNSKSKMPYTFEIINIISFEKNQSILCSRLEEKIHKKLNQYSYEPLIPFKGKHECYREEVLDTLIGLMDVEGQS